MSDSVSSTHERHDRAYWFQNRLLMLALLLLWALFGLGCGIFWADSLNQYKLFQTGYPLGFWFAQQGSIIGFVLIILTYAVVMNALDRRHERLISESNASQSEAEDAS